MNLDGNRKGVASPPPTCDLGAMMKINWPFSPNFDTLDAKLDQVIHMLNLLSMANQSQGKAIMSALSDLQAQVAQNSSVEGSALTLIQGLAAQLAAAIAAGDPAALTTLQTQLATSATALAAAVKANTPAA